MISFEVGKRYAEIDEYLTEYEVIARTKAFVTVKNNQGKTQRIKVWTHDGVEALGSLLHASFEVGNESLRLAIKKLLMQCKRMNQDYINL